MRSSVLLFTVSLLTLPKAAEAHFNLLAPPSSNTSNAMEGGKGAPPCGPDSAPSTAPTAIQGGKTFTLKINETVYHKGFYRVALALHSRSELPADPAVTTAVVNGMTVATGAIATDMAFPVLANNLFATHTAAGAQESQIKIPNVNCDKCTLQVIEFMQDHTANPGGLYFYHHCADLKITADPNLPLEHGDGGAGGAGGASSGGAGGGSSGGSSGGTAGSGSVAAGAGGTPAGGGTGGSSAGSASVGISGGGSVGIPTTGGAPATATAGSSSVGANAGVGGIAVSFGGPDGDSGGCAVSKHSAGSKPLLSVLLGLLVLGRRRNRRRPNTSSAVSA